MANAAQVSFTFFADSPDEQDRTFRSNLLRLDRPRQRDQRSESTTVVRDSGRKQPVAGSNDRELRPRCEHSVMLRADNTQRRSRSAFDQSETAALFIDLYVGETQSRKLLCEILSTLAFTKRRCGDRTDPDLFIRDCLGGCMEETERTLHFCRGQQRAK